MSYKLVGVGTDRVQVLLPNENAQWAPYRLVESDINSVGEILGGMLYHFSTLTPSMSKEEEINRQNKLRR